MRVLIIDDEEDTQRILVSFLESEGFQAETARTSIDGLEKVQREALDLVILDVRLPTLSGSEVCRRIRVFSDVPILMVSAYARDSQDIIHGLNLGADDYLPKPLDLDVLKARINALIRRSVKVGSRVVRPAYVDDRLEIDLHRQQLRVKGEPVSLSPLEYQLLGILVRSADEAVPTMEIIEELWPNADYDAYLRHVHTYVKRLRMIIEPEPGQPRYIINEHGLGYRFVTHSG